MTIGDRIKEARIKKGLMQKELSKLIGVSPSAVSNYEIGVSSPKEEVLSKLIEVLEVDANYFFQDIFPLQDFSFSIEEKTLIENFRTLDQHGKKAVNAVLDIELERIQQEAENTNKVIQLNSVLTYDLPASAGTGMFLDSESCEHIDYPADEVPQGTDFAVRISGDSMSPDYADGSIAFVRKEQVKQGEIGVFVLNGESYIKQLDKKGGKLCLVSLNPAYKPIKILDTDSLYCVGKVLN